MSLRTKFVVIFLILSVLPIVTTTVLEIDRTMTVMVDDLSNSAHLLINQTFEQMRAISDSNGGDAVAAARENRVLLAFIESSQAFGKGVVYVRIKKLDGMMIVAVPPESSADQREAAPFDGLQSTAAQWWPLSQIQALWSARTYEMSQFVEVNDHPIAIISVGISTSLIAPEVHRVLANILTAFTLALGLSLLGAVFFGGLVLRPLAVITNGVEQMAVGRDDVRFRVAGSDELSILGQKFNQLSERIRLSYSKWAAEREQLLSILRSITDAVLLLDSSGIVLFANTEAQGRLGLPAGGLADGKSLDLLLGETNPLVRVINTASAVGGGVQDVPLEMSDGSSRVHFLVSVFALDRRLLPASFLAIVRDFEPVRELENIVDHSDGLLHLGD